MKGSQSKKNYDLGATVCLMIFLCILMLQQFLVLPLRVAQLLLMIIGVVNVSFLKKNTPNIYLMSFFFIYTLFGLIAWFHNTNADLIEYLWIIPFGGIAILLLNKTPSFKVMNWFYFIAMLTIDFLILIHDGVDNLPMASSRNAISSMGILFFSIYCIVAHKVNQKVNIAVPLVFIVTALLGIGRSGVLLAGALIMACLVWDINIDTFRLKKPIYICFMIFVLGILSIILYEKIIFPALQNIGWRGIVSQDRLEIWNSYFGKSFSDLENILWGAHLSGDHWLELYSSNLHNSFLNLHSKYGLPTLVIILSLTIYAIFYFIKKRKMIFLVPFIAIIFRAQLDYTNFNGTADVVWYYFIFYPYFDKYSNRVKETL